jgi:hypothetical protein
MYKQKRMIARITLCAALGAAMAVSTRAAPLDEDMFFVEMDRLHDQLELYQYRLRMAEPYLPDPRTNAPSYGATGAQHYDPDHPCDQRPADQPASCHAYDR